MTVAISWPSRQPMQATWPQMPTGAASKAQTNATQMRGTTQIGRTWTETYGPLGARNAVDMAWLAQVNTIVQRRMVIAKYHPSQQTILGTGAGSPLVHGAGQVGSNIITTGWAPGQTVLRAGDIVLLPGGRVVYDITADVVSDGSGNATLPINPPVWAGASPTDNGFITTNATPGAVTYRCIVKSFQGPTAGAAEWYQGATVVFQEIPPQSFTITFGGGTHAPVGGSPTGSFIGGSLAGGTPSPTVATDIHVPEPPPLTIAPIAPGSTGSDTTPNTGGPLSLAPEVGSDPPHTTVVGHGSSVSSRAATAFAHPAASAVALALSPGDQPRPTSQVAAVLARYVLAWQSSWIAQDGPPSLARTQGNQPPHLAPHNPPTWNGSVWGPQHNPPMPR